MTDKAAVNRYFHFRLTLRQLLSCSYFLPDMTPQYLILTSVNRSIRSCYMTFSQIIQQFCKWTQKTNLSNYTYQGELVFVLLFLAGYDSTISHFYHQKENKLELLYDHLAKSYWYQDNHNQKFPLGPHVMGGCSHFPQPDRPYSKRSMDCLTLKTSWWPLAVGSFGIRF